MFTSPQKGVLAITQQLDIKKRLILAHGVRKISSIHDQEDMAASVSLMFQEAGRDECRSSAGLFLSPFKSCLCCQSDRIKLLGELPQFTN